MLISQQKISCKLKKGTFINKYASTIFILLCEPHKIWGLLVKDVAFKIQPDEDILETRCDANIALGHDLLPSYCRKLPPNAGFF